MARPLYNTVTVAIVFAAGLLHARTLAPEPYPFVSSSYSLWWTVYAAAQLVAGYAIGLPEVASSRLGAALRGFATAVVAFGAISVIQGLLATPLLPRSSLVIIGLVCPLWTVVAWNLSRDASLWAAGRHRVYLVIDRPEDAAGVELDLAGAPEFPATLVGVCTLAEVRRAGTAPIVRDGALAAGATVVVLDAASQASVPVVDQAADLHRLGIRIRTLSLFYEEWIGKLPHAELARVSLLFDVGELHRARYVRVKRVVDLVFAACGLVAFVPLAVVVATLNPILNRGPLIYRQTRVGRNGEPFTIYKLRTMVPSDGESDWTADGDSRITSLGRFLRRTHLDELAQVVNIVRGDLSLVGPRPEQPQYVAELSDKIAFYDVRHIVRPGLTGWAQVKQGYAADHHDAFEKLQYDFYYLRRQGVALDARIIRRTIQAVLRGDGR